MKSASQGERFSYSRIEFANFNHIDYMVHIINDEVERLLPFLVIFKHGNGSRNRVQSFVA